MTAAIHSLLVDLASTSKRNTKKKYILQYINGPHGQLVLEFLDYALNPFNVYHANINKFPKPSKKYDKEIVKLWPEIKFNLDRLKNGEVNSSVKKNILSDYMRNPICAPVISRIISKDLKSGVGPSTVNDACPGSISNFDICLAQAYRRKNATYPSWIEPKFDGVRAISIVGENGIPSIYSRTGKAYSNFKHIESEIQDLKLRNVVLDGEIIGNSFEGVMNIAYRKDRIDNRNISYITFDAIPLSDFNKGKCDIDLSRRIDILRECILGRFGAKPEHVKIPYGEIVYNESEMWEAHKRHMSLGYEGSILKDINSTYEFKRTKSWLKIKPVLIYDCRIVDYYKGKGKYAGTLGGLVVEYNSVRTRVGAGFTDSQRNYLWNNIDFFVGCDCEVLGQEITKNGAIRFPRFLRLREDKII